MPGILGRRLIEQIQQELKTQGLARHCGQVEILQHSVEADAKGRWRVSYVLTDAVGIKRAVVFCKRGWRVEIWADERLSEEFKNPRVPLVSPHSPSGANVATSTPGVISCS